MSSWTKAVVPRDSCKWPNMCPSCLKPPDHMYPIPSHVEKPLSRFEYEYLIISVPFCETCASRQWRWLKLSYWLLGAALVVAVALSLWLDLNRWQAGFLGVILGIPGIWLQLFKDWVVRIVDYDNNTLTLEIKRPEYAREVANLNNNSPNIMSPNLCTYCRTKYNPKDYRDDANEWLCSRCSKPLNKLKA
jgi:hypothetical protein